MKIKLTKGLDLPIAGRVEELAPRAVAAARVAIVPDDYPASRPRSMWLWAMSWRPVRLSCTTRLTPG